MLEALKDKEKNNAEDKVRLLIVFYLAHADNAIPKEDIAEYENALKEAGADISAWQYVKKYVILCTPLATAQLILTSHLQTSGDHTHGKLHDGTGSCYTASRPGRRDVQRLKFH